MTVSWFGNRASASLTKPLKSKRELTRIKLLEARTRLTQLDDAEEISNRKDHPRCHWLGQSNSRSDGDRL